MSERLLELLVDESKWIFPALVVALALAGRLFVRARRAGEPQRLTILRTMSLFAGCLIGILGAGHVLAVSIKLSQGTLDGSLALLYLLGAALLLPSSWLALHVARHDLSEPDAARRTLQLNAALGLVLLALGPANAPLALPALLNVGYQLHRRRAVGWTLVSLSALAALALLVGSFAFLASGESFEEFSGLETPS